MIIMCLTEVEPPPIHGMIFSCTKIIVMFEIQMAQVYNGHNDNTRNLILIIP